MALHRGLHVWSLKRYCVTVMDSWTPLRLFWTRKGAIKWRDRMGSYAHAYKWQPTIKSWMKMERDMEWHASKSRQSGR